MAYRELSRTHVQEVIRRWQGQDGQRGIARATDGGKTIIAQCLGSAAVGAGHRVVFDRADALLRDLHHARADHNFDKAFRRFLAPELLVLDDFGLQRLSAQQSQDLYELIIERQRRSSFIVTSNPPRRRMGSVFSMIHPWQQRFGPTRKRRAPGRH